MIAKRAGFWPAAAAAGVSFLSVVLPLAGQTSAADQADKTQKRFSFGIRGRLMPVKALSVIANRTALDTVTAPAPVRDFSYVTSSHSPLWGAGLALDYVFAPGWNVSLEALFDRMRYTKVTGVAWGTDDPATTTDDRSHMFLNEDTRATLFEFPVLVHHRLVRDGPLSKLYVAGGAALRVTTNIRSSTTTTFADTTTSTNNFIVRPEHRNVVGGVIGVGFRILDDFNLSWTPEVRYTRWAASTYGSTSTVSPKNQLEVGIGFTF